MFSLQRRKYRAGDGEDGGDGSRKGEFLFEKYGIHNCGKDESRAVRERIKHAGRERARRERHKIVGRVHTHGGDRYPEIRSFRKSEKLARLRIFFFGASGIHGASGIRSASGILNGFGIRGGIRFFAVFKHGNRRNDGKERKHDNERNEVEKCDLFAASAYGVQFCRNVTAGGRKRAYRDPHDSLFAEFNVPPHAEQHDGGEDNARSRPLRSRNGFARV